MASASHPLTSSPLVLPLPNRASLCFLSLSAQREKSLKRYESSLLAAGARGAKGGDLSTGPRREGDESPARQARSSIVRVRSRFSRLRSIAMSENFRYRSLTAEAQRERTEPTATTTTTTTTGGAMRQRRTSTSPMSRPTTRLPRSPTQTFFRSRSWSKTSPRFRSRRRASGRRSSRSRARSSTRPRPSRTLRSRSRAPRATSTS